MLYPIRRAARNTPFAISGILWPLTLLAPYVPGLPRPDPSGLTWRQEMLVALLCSVTFALLIKSFGKSLADSFPISRKQLLLYAPLLMFVLWSGASSLWAANPYPAIHHTFVWGAYLLFFLIMEQVVRRPTLLYASLTLLGVVILIISIACIIGYIATPLSLLRNNGLGEPLAIVVPLFAAISLKVRERRAAIFCGAVAVLSWLAMLAMLERAFFISTSVGLLLLALFIIVSPHFRPHSITRATLLALSIALGALLPSIPSPFTKEDAVVIPSVTSRLKETSSEDLNTRARFLFWNVAVEMVRSRPLTGIGADNYDVAFAEGRAQFAKRHPDSPLVEINEGFLAVRAHNEYLQILAELGAVGLALFLAFIAGLLWTAWHALRYSRSPLVPGAICSLTVFALSSGASSISFRWMGSGLIFFFAASLLTRFASAEAQSSKAVVINSLTFLPRKGAFVALAFSVVMLLAMGAQSLNVLFNGAAQASADRFQAESRFRSALFWNPYDAAANFNYGMWLYYQGRAREGLPHIRFGVENGINTSVCYVYLATAEAEAGEQTASEATLQRAIEVYPRSIFLRVRHASVLASLGKEKEAEGEYEKALSLNNATARGWWQLICFGKEAAARAALKDPQNVVWPGGLFPLEAVHFIVAENKRRPPTGCNGNLEAAVK